MSKAKLQACKALKSELDGDLASIMEQLAVFRQKVKDN